MELEESIEYLKELVEAFYVFPNPQSIEIKDSEIKYIETVLKALENSIPKEEIEKKIEELNKGKMDIITSPIYSRDEKLQILERNRLKKEILQELLKE